jgi:hypothetical protein
MDDIAHEALQLYNAVRFDLQTTELYVRVLHLRSNVQGASQVSICKELQRQRRIEARGAPLRTP